MTNKDCELIKIVKNILQYSEDAEINDVFIEFIDDSFMEIILNKSDRSEFTLEIIDILSYIRVNWSDTLTKHNLIQFFEENLQELSGNPLSKINSFQSSTNTEEYLLRVIDFLTNVSSIKFCAKVLEKSKIITLLYQNLKRTTHCDIIFAIVSCLYQLMPWEETRSHIISNDDLITTIIKFLKREEKDISFVSLRFLEIVQLYDRKKAERIKRKKFKAQFREFTNALKEIKNKLNENIGYDYDEEDEDDVARQVDYNDDDGLMGNYKYH